MTFHISEVLPSPTILGLERPFIAGNWPSVTCHVHYYCAHNVTLTWDMGGKEIPAQLTEITTNSSVMASFSSKIFYNFSRREDNKVIACIATTLDGLYRNSTTKIVRVHCTYMGCLFDSQTIHLRVMVIQTKPSKGCNVNIRPIQA